MVETAMVLFWQMQKFQIVPIRLFSAVNFITAGLCSLLAVVNVGDLLPLNALDFG